MSVTEMSDCHRSAAELTSLSLSRIDIAISVWGGGSGSYSSGNNNSTGTQLTHQDWQIENIYKGEEGQQEDQERGGEEEQEVHWKAADPGLEKVRLDNKQFLMLRIGNLYCDMS